MVHDEMERLKTEITKIAKEVTEEKVQEMKEDLTNFSRDEFRNFRENFLKELKSELVM